MPPFYDSMLARVIASAPTRREALARLAAGLDSTVCWGVTTNREFLARVVRDDEFGAGAFDTTFLERRFGDDAARATPAPTWLEAIAAASLALLPRAPLPPLWSGWSSSPSIDTLVPIEIDGAVRRWRLTRIARVAGRLLRRGDASHRRVVATPRRRRSDASKPASMAEPFASPPSLPATSATGRPRAASSPRSTCACAAARAPRTVASGTLVAPMHGRVTEACVEAGATVAAGALLVVIEAMKMEHQIRAPHAGTIAALHVRAGDQVAVRQPLVEVRA